MNEVTLDALPQGAGQVELLTAVMDDMPVPETHSPHAPADASSSPRNPGR